MLKKPQHEHTETKSGSLKHKIKCFYSLLILIRCFKGILIVIKRETKRRVTQWVGQLAADAEKLRDFSAFFEEDWKKPNIVLLLKLSTGKCGARQLEIITIPLTPEKRLNQIIRWSIIPWHLKVRCSLIPFIFFLIQQISFYNKQTGIVGTRETICATHKCVSVWARVGPAYRKYTWRCLSNRGKNVRASLLAVTSACAAAYAEDSAV